MSAPSTFTELKASIADWLNRDDLTDTIPEFIALAENRFNRLLLVPEREVSATASISAETVPLPLDFWSIRSVYLDNAPRVALQQISLSELRNIYSASDTGRPVHYAVQGGDTLVLGPIPNGTYTLKLNYYETIPALGDAQATNWLLTAYPDLYLSAALGAAYIYLRDVEGATMHQAIVGNIMAEIMAAGQRKQHGGAPLVRKAFKAVRGIQS